VTDGALIGNPVADAVHAFATGRPVLILDDEPGGADGVVAFAAERASAQLVSRVVRSTSGYLSVALPERELARLGLPMLATDPAQAGKVEPFAVSVDAREGVSTGISAADRARTMRLLASAHTTAADLTRPGHVPTLRAREGGVLRRPARAEAAVDLADMAQLRPAAVLGEVVSRLDPTRMAGPDELRALGQQHGVPVVTVAQVVAYRLMFKSVVQRGPSVRMPLPAGEFQVVGYTSTGDNREHVALVHGEIGDGRDVLVRVHRECVTGDVFGSLRCRCVERLQAAIEAIAAEGRGVIVYIRNDDDQDSGLMRKLHVYAAEDEAHHRRPPGPELEVPADVRDYGTGAQILRDLEVHTMRMLTNSSSRMAGLAAYGLEIVGTVPLSIGPALTPSYAS
jgi:3,4-dihydroxy 2-butanone 4-phosphate synthase/GTP cyclohydrolase II